MTVTYTTDEELAVMFGAPEIEEVARLPNGDLDVQQLDRARVTALGLINGYLAALYALPLTTTPSVLKQCEGDLARYYLYDDDPTEIVVERYKQWLKWLSDVAKGVVSLDAPLKSVNSFGGIAIRGAPKIFTDQVLASGQFGTLEC
jgi:phage gp36-like protein